MTRTCYDIFHNDILWDDGTLMYRDMLDTMLCCIMAPCVAPPLDASNVAGSGWRSLLHLAADPAAGCRPDLKGG